MTGAELAPERGVSDTPPATRSPAVKRRLGFDPDAAGLWLKRLAVVVSAGCWLLLAARSLVNADFPEGRPTLALVLAFGPIAAYLTLRAPAIFPFGAYLALVPLDVLLSVSSGATLTRLLAIATAAALILRMIISRRVLAPPRAWWAWLLWVTWSLVTLLWTPDINAARTYYGSILQLFLMMTILAVYPFTRRDFRFVLFAIVTTGVLEGAYALWEYHSGAFGISEARISIESSAGVLIDQNYFAGSFILPAAIALATALFTRSATIRLLAALSLPFMMLALFLSGSRGGFVSLLILLAYLALRSRYRLRASLAIAVSLALTSLTPSIWDRFLNDPSAASGSGRTFIWSTALSTLKEHWLFGAGVGSFPTVYDQALLKSFQATFQNWGRPPHSIIVGVVTETGVIGLVLVLAAWYQSFRQSRAVPAGSEFYPIRLAFEASIVALFINALFIDPAYIKYMWLANTLPMVLTNVFVQSKLRSAKAVPPNVSGNPLAARGAAFPRGRIARA